MSKATDREDAEGFAYDVVNALYAFMHKEEIAPAVMAQWVAGCEYMNHHGDRSKPENQVPRRLAFLWLLDAMVASPAAVAEALQVVRERLVDAFEEELQPYAVGQNNVYQTQREVLDAVETIALVLKARQDT